MSVKPIKKLKIECDGDDNKTESFIKEEKKYMSAKKQGNEGKQASADLSKMKKQVKEKYQKKHGPLIAAWEKATQLAKYKVMN